MLGMKFFTKTIAEFHQQYPEIIIRFVEDGANHLKKASNRRRSGPGCYALSY